MEIIYFWMASSSGSEVQGGVTITISSSITSWEHGLIFKIKSLKIFDMMNINASNGSEI